MKFLGLEPRKLILLMLPISVAFIVGGYSGSLLGYKGFFWAGAIMWSTIIGIIDYNFTLIKRGLGFLGTTGRVVLILTSAIITSTVGDHIILEDTVKTAKEIHFQAKIDALNLQPIIPVIRPGLEQEIADAKVKVDSKLTEIANVDAEILQQCGVTRPGPRCEALRNYVMPPLKDSYKIFNSTYQALLKEFNSAAEVARLKRVKEIKVIQDQAKKHDIVLEMKLLYGEIFKETITTIMFFLFAMMVICIETLPLLLKSGLTEGQVKNDEEIEREREKEREKKNKSNIQKSPF